MCDEAGWLASGGSVKSHSSSLGCRALLVAPTALQGALGRTSTPGELVFPKAECLLGNNAPTILLRARIQNKILLIDPVGGYIYIQQRFM